MTAHTKLPKTYWAEAFKTIVYVINRPPSVSLEGDQYPIEGVVREGCWGQGRQCGSASNILDGEEPTYESKQNTHIERERDRNKTVIYSNSATVTKDNQPSLKVTKSLYIVTVLGQLPFMLFT